MTVTACTLNSRRDTRAGLGDVSHITETWTAYCNSIMDAQDVINDIGSVTVGPKVRDRHVAATQYVYTSVTASSLTPLTWRIEAEATAMHDHAAHEGYCRLSRRGGMREVRTWISPNEMPTTGDAPWFPTAAIAGTRVNIFGEPEIRRVWHHQVSVDVWIDRSMMMLCNGTTDWLATWNEAIGCRNSSEWIGYSAGTAVFLGWSESLTNDPWTTYTLQFEADAWYHLEQRVLPHVDGSVLLEDVTTVAGVAIRQATKAYWYQPFRKTKVGFNTLWNFTEVTIPTPGAPPCP